MFGASAPLAKRLLGHTAPQLLAGLLYGGAAIVLSVAMACRRHNPEARLRREDLPKVGVVTLTGGVLAPVLLLVGLDRVTGVAGSLLLNLEAVLTMALALFLFGEHLSRRAFAGAAAVVLASTVLGLGGGGSRVDAVGIVAIAAACALWAIDNNVTQRLSGRDPFAIVRAKAAVAGSVNLALAAALGAVGPSVLVIFAACALGGAAYGLSIVLDAYALRWAGAAREAAYFASAPLFGVLTAVVVLDERVTAAEGLAMVVMAAGIFLLVTERHEHRHVHAPVEHDHRHRHDDGHHDHVHEPPVEAHAHPHVHVGMAHAHPHVSDAHHRHGHDDRGGA